MFFAFKKDNIFYNFIILFLELDSKKINLLIFKRYISKRQKIFSSKKYIIYIIYCGGFLKNYNTRYSKGKFFKIIF